MKARHVAAAIVGGAIAVVAGYLIGVQVGFTGGIRASAKVLGVAPDELAAAVTRMTRSARASKARNLRMGD